MQKDKEIFLLLDNILKVFKKQKILSDNFEIQGIEIVANSQGIVDFSIGHPSETMSNTKF